jgi:hypothetical protein
MSEEMSFSENKPGFKKLAENCWPELPSKLKLLLPYKKEIRALRARKVAYDDIRLLLEKANVIVTLDTVYRFCRRVIHIKPSHPYKAREPNPTSPNALPVGLPSPEKIEATLREQRERFPGPWSRRKRGPRIANSKNL